MTAVEATSFPIFAAVAEAERRPLVVSIHDIAPPTRAAAEKIVAELGRRGVGVCSLLVVPDYHGTGRAVDDKEFVRWLRDLQGDGHEIVIHGYFHKRPRREGESVCERAATRYYTKDEGEFYDLGYDEALERITRARDEFTSAGLTPRGFIAPAWLLGREAERAAADAELEYTTRLTAVRDLRNGHDFAARSLVYSVRSAWRRSLSLAWNGGLAHVLSAAPLLRLSLHPPDLGHPRIWNQVIRLVDSVSATRTPTTYRDWLAERRVQPSHH